MDTPDRAKTAQQDEPCDPHMPLIYDLELHREIELEAYKLAEQDGFRLSPMDYWLAAEKEVHKFF